MINYRIWRPSWSRDQWVVVAAAGGNVTALAARSVAKSTPLAFIVGDDPVRLGLVNILNRPGGNATGVSIFTTELGPKRLEILNELLPKTSKIGLLINPAQRFLFWG
jgi:putative ABC transport system substrate-binding protein